MTGSATFAVRRSGERPIAGLSTLAAVLGAVLTEAFLLGQQEQGVWRQGGLLAALTLAWLVWFWLTLGVLSDKASNKARAVLARRGRWLRWAVGALALACGAAALGLYLTSWVLYLRAGRFANVEAVHFAAVNTRMIWLYLAQAERSVLAGCGVMAVGLLAILALWIRAVLRVGVEQSVAPPRARPRTRRLVWYALTLLWVALAGVAYSDPIRSRRELRLAALHQQMHPVVTLLASFVESFRIERISACLDPAELSPIESGVPRPAPTAGPAGPSMILLAVESLRHDVVHLRAQGIEVMPHLNALARGGLHVTRAYTQSTHSDYADGCVVSSLFPLRSRRHHFYRDDDPWPKTLIYDLLRPAGYATAIISSQNEAWGAMDRFLRSPHLDHFFDARSSASARPVSAMDTGFADEVRAGTLRAGKLDDRETADAAIEWITRQVEAGRPFFLGLNFQNSHFPYEIGADAPRPFQPSTLDFLASFLDYPEEKVEVARNAYYNALHESDRQLGRLVQALRDLGRLEDTILVVFGENGEAFHEKGLVTHAKHPIEPAVRVACVLHAPAWLPPGTEDYPVALIDLVPTVLGLVGRPSHPGFQGIDFLDAQRPPLEQRLLFVHTENPLTRADAVWLGGRFKFTHDRTTGNEELYDLAGDPGERTNLLEREPVLAARLRATLASWRERQLAYYYYPFYYERFYPPRPPALAPVD